MRLTKTYMLILASLLVPFVFQLVRFGTPSLVFSIKNSTPVSPLYSLRSGKEYLQSYFIFGDEDLAHWYLELESKRLKEAQLLYINHVNNLAKTELSTAKQLQSQASILIAKLKDTTNTTYLTDQLATNSQMLSALIKSIDN